LHGSSTTTIHTPVTGAVFLEPEPKITKFSRLVGLDGKAKMSKSLGNTILLSDGPEEVMKKMRNAVTDTEKNPPERSGAAGSLHSIQLPLTVQLARNHRCS